MFTLTRRFNAVHNKKVILNKLSDIEFQKKSKGELEKSRLTLLYP